MQKEEWLMFKIDAQYNKRQRKFDNHYLCTMKVKLDRLKCNRRRHKTRTIEKRGKYRLVFIEVVEHKVHIQTLIRLRINHILTSNIFVDYHPLMA